MTCPNCDERLLCKKCNRPVFSGDPPEWPGGLCSECFFKLGKKPMIDFELGWRAVPGMFSPEDGKALQEVVSRLPRGTAHVELGAWAGRSLAAACEVLPDDCEALSVDSYLLDSQANESSPMHPETAKNLRELVGWWYVKNGKKVNLVTGESSSVGASYDGPLIASLLIDDHHSAAQVTSNVKAWMKHFAEKCTVLLHDYLHPPYEIEVTAKKILPGIGFDFRGMVSGLGIWGRG